VKFIAKQLPLTDYPMVKHAREIINQGKIGKIRMVMGEYLQEWLARPVEKKGNRQASWRTDPLTSTKFALIVLIE
jgi:predicted dehydrogenase